MRVLLGSLPAALFSPGWDQLLTYFCKARAASPEGCPGLTGTRGRAGHPPIKGAVPGWVRLGREKSLLSSGREAGWLCVLCTHLPRGQGLSWKGSQSLSLNQVAFVSLNSALWAEQGAPKGLGQWASTPPCTPLPGDMPPSGQTRGVTGRCGVPLAHACPPPPLSRLVGTQGPGCQSCAPPAAQGPGFLGENCGAAPRHVPVLTQKGGGGQQTGQGWSRAAPRHPARCPTPGANGMSPGRQE